MPAISGNRPARQPQPSIPASPEMMAAGLSILITFAGPERGLVGGISLARVGTGHTFQATPVGLGVSSNGGTNYFSTPVGTQLVAASANSFAVVLRIRLNATGQSNTYAVFERLLSGTGDQNAIIYGYSANQFEFYGPAFSGSDPRTGSGITVNDTLPHTVVYNYDGKTWSGYLDGAQIFSVARAFTLPVNDPTGTAAILNAAGDNQINATVMAYAAFKRGLPSILARSISENANILFARQRTKIIGGFSSAAAPRFRSRSIYGTRAGSRSAG